MAGEGGDGFELVTARASREVKEGRVPRMAASSVSMRRVVI